MAEQQETTRQFDDIFAALAAPFAPDVVKTRTQGGRTFSYVTARTMMNRLDDVLGASNWWDEYFPSEYSVICKLTIRLPNGETITKYDAGGFAGMSDQGDDDKSGFSDAFKRACVKYGPGRYLYCDGLPNYVMAELQIGDLGKFAPRGGDDSHSNGGGYQRQSSPPPRQQQHDDRQRGREEVNRQFAPQNGNGNGRSSFPDVGDPGQMPRSGGAMFAWSRKKEDEGYQGVLRAVSDLGKKFGFPDRMKEWSQGDIEQVWGVITGGGNGNGRQPEPAGAMRRDFGPDTPDEDCPF